MSISMNLYYTGTDGNARKFAEEMERTGVADTIRAEPGNLRYEYFYPVNDPETVLLIDIWRDQAALDTHHATDMMNKITQLRDKYQLRIRAERYLSDETGISAHDAAFMRTKADTDT